MRRKAGFLISYAAAFCASADVMALGAAPEKLADGYLGEAFIYSAVIDSRHLLIGLYQPDREAPVSVFTFVARDRLEVSPELRNVDAKVYFVPGQLLRIAPVGPHSRTLLFSTTAATEISDQSADIWLKGGVHLCRSTASGLHKRDFNSLRTTLHCTADLGGCSTDSGDVISFSC